MTCCGNKAKKIYNKGKNIVAGYKNYVTGKTFDFTNSRINICENCVGNYWIKGTLWCSICKCFIPAKARVENEKCPLDKWAK